MEPIFIEKCKEKIEQIPCHLTPIACKKGKILLWEKCIQVFIESNQANSDSKTASCSTEKGGGGTT